MKCFQLGGEHANVDCVTFAQGEASRGGGDSESQDQQSWAQAWVDRRYTVLPPPYYRPVMIDER